MSAKGSLNGWPGRYRSPAYWVAVCGVGLFRPAPGTWGSLAGALAGYGLTAAFDLTAAALLGLVAVGAVAGVIAIRDCERRSGVHDAPEIVIDEVVGQWVAVIPLFMLFDTPEEALTGWILAFALFRLFDIIKPWPIGPVDRHVTGAIGVMLDDILAGLMTALCLVFLWYGGFL